VFFATVSKSCVDNKTGSIDGIACPGWGESSFPWSDAMGVVLVSGLFYLLLTVTGLRAMLFVAIPKSMRAGITAGIGFFITIIGLTIGQITRVTLANWGLAYHVYPAGECDSYCSRHQLPAVLPWDG
jgi:xanthine/uracil/vitamin C permease (AzgA family)